VFGVWCLVDWMTRESGMDEDGEKGFYSPVISAAVWLGD
jgi:hypothetical protein